MYFNISKIDFKKESENNFIVLAKINFAGTGEGPTPPPPIYDGLYFTPADNIASTTVGYQYAEYYNKHGKYLQTSSNGQNWTDWTEDKTILTGQKMFVRGLDSYVRNTSTSTGFFTTTDLTEVGGNIMSLIGDAETITTNYCFHGLFINTSITSAPELPATTLANYCYQNMFNGCWNLTQAPELPATTLTTSCYQSMFQGCTALTQAPALPATRLIGSCYRSMFQNCASLTTAPELPATSLANSCYRYMFNGCSSLTQAPALPATSLLVSSYCYNGMFMNCTELTQAPELPATTLAGYCYQDMFSGCFGLTQAPELPATTLTSRCYSGMFSGCSLLTTAPTLTATSLNSWCYNNMFNGCSNLNEITVNGVFDSTKAENWVQGVAPTGKFYNLTGTTIPVGTNGIPTGWTEVKPVEPLTFTTSVPQSTIGYQYDEYYNNHGKYLQYNIDGGEWQDWTSDVTIYSGDVMNVKGEDNYVRKSQQHITGFFSMTGRTAVGGNIMGLIGGAEETRFYCFNRLFMNTSLTSAPTLPATTLADGCYYGMFEGCSSLTQAPELPATTLATNCYYGMFNGCNGLTTAPALPATTLAPFCYTSMFKGCSSLTSAPTLPVTTLAQSCYNSMFNGCSSLTQAPTLPATTLEHSCYHRMFDGCSSLTSAPELPATTLATNCYAYMFNGCTNLNEITVSGTFNSGYAEDWVSGVSTSGTFYNNTGTDIPVGTSGIPTGWTEVKPVIPMYFMVENGDMSTIGYKYDEYYNNHGKYLQKSYDNVNWTDWTEDVMLVSPAEGSTKLYVKGEDNWVRNSLTSTGFFTTTDPVKMGGNIMSLCNYAETITRNNCFNSLFGGTSITSAPALPVTTLVDYCYYGMFINCSSLQTAPTLPATTLATNCYAYMFNGCSSLQTAPALPAQTLYYQCYSYMFSNCTSLTKAPVLSATKRDHWSTTGYYDHMFNGCTNLNEITISGLFTSSNATSWVDGVAPTGTFYNLTGTDIPVGTNGIPTGWTVVTE